MARPKKQKQEKLDKVLPIRCTQTDYTTLRTRAEKAGLSLSSFVRDAALHSKIIVKQSAVDFSLIQELKRSGNNLNQIAMHYNATGFVAPPEFDRVISLHDEILNKILNAI